MAFQMAYEDSCGNSYDTSYWRVVQVNISAADLAARVVLYGYKDKDARDENKTPIVGAIKAYDITGDEFVTYYTQHLAPGGPNIAEMCYLYAKEKKDTGNPAVSFFDKATDV